MIRIDFNSLRNGLYSIDIVLRDGSA